MALPISVDVGEGLTIAASISLDRAADRVWDVVVVGAGPAGALAARQLALGGAGVLLVDKAEFPRWKVCGSCLNRRTLSLLGRAGLGELVSSLGAVPIASMEWIVDGERATLARPSGVVVSRERFDAGLVAAAISAGARFLPSTVASTDACDHDARSVLMRRDGERGHVRARLVLAADGLGGRLLGHEEPGTPPRRRTRIGAGAIVETGFSWVEQHKLYMVCGSGGYVGLVRLEDDRVAIGAALDRALVLKSGGIAGAVGRLLDNAGVASITDVAALSWRGTPPLHFRPRRIAATRIFALGDAAGYVEPFTGEGIAWALEGAMAVTEPALAAVQRWDESLVQRWTGLHARRIRRRQWTSRMAANLLRHPRLVCLAIRLIRRRPNLARPIVNYLNQPCTSATAIQR